MVLRVVVVVVACVVVVVVACVVVVVGGVVAARKGTFAQIQFNFVEVDGGTRERECVWTCVSEYV